MPLVPFQDLMRDAEAGNYAVGYFESWSCESLLAVADAAECSRSPVILGFSGIYLPHPQRVRPDPLSMYAAMGLAVAGKLSVPCCLLFNESPNDDWVLEALDLGFGLVMYTEENPDPVRLVEKICKVVQRAHARGAAVEGEVSPLPGVGGDLAGRPVDGRDTAPDMARRFVEQTGIDALAVNIGQAHLHGRQYLRLDLQRLRHIKAAVPVPLVLHGASSVDPTDLQSAIHLGIRKVNLGSLLKQAFYSAMSQACANSRPDSNPYELIGSGLSADVLMAGRQAMQSMVQTWMDTLGSAGRAGRHA